MKKQFYSTNKFIVSIFMTIIIIVPLFIKAQTTTVFSDNFNTSMGTGYTTSQGTIGSSTSWLMKTASSSFEAKIDGGILNLKTSGTGSGAIYAYTNTSSFSAPYTTQLNSNIGVVTWTFNMRQIRTDPSGMSSGSYGAAVILASSTSNVLSSTGSSGGIGYAVYFGTSGSTDPIYLARYSNGIRSGTITPIITSNTSGLTDFGADYLSVKVTYNPSSNSWELFLRNDGSTAFSDPSSGTLISQGTATNNTYTGTSLGFMGAVWNGSSTANQTAFFDNFKVTVKKLDQTISFEALSDKTYGDPAFNLTATGGASGNPVTFSSSNSSVATCSGTNGSTVTIVGVGSTSITASQTGDANYNAALPVTQNLTVNSALYTVTFNVTDGINPVPGAVVSFNSLTQLTNSMGTTVFTNIITGNNQAYSISKNGYNTINSSLNVAYQDIVINNTFGSQTATNLVVIGTPTANTATLGWSGNGATNYQILYYINGSTNYFLQSTTASPFTIQALEPNTIYNCRIRSLIGGIYSSYSPIVSFVTSSGTSILATNLAVQGTPTVNSVTLIWNGSGATNYQIQYNPTGTSEYHIYTASSSPVTITGLTQNTTYDCRIRTYSGGMYTSYSQAISFTTPNYLSVTATNLAVQSIGANSATLTWTGSGATYYQIQYFINGSTEYFFQNSSTGPFTLQALQPNTTYNCRIRTYNGGSFTSYSSIVSFTTSNGSSVLATNLSVQGIPTATTATLLWNGSGATSYQIQYYVTGTTNYKFQSSTSSPVTLTGLLPNTNYDCRIRTYSGGIYTSYSPVTTFTTASLAKYIAELESISKDPISEAVIYPNPAIDFYNLDFYSETEGTVSLSIYSIDGKLYESRIIETSLGLNHFELKTPDISTGIYYIMLNKGDFTSKLKLIKQ
ncbi:MAG: fibronectin type III domain-containing protein [Bacteroidia bacterium]|nr:fibronectin type III domain-containing protein [Bacteroidia bacterium]